MYVLLVCNDLPKSFIYYVLKEQSSMIIHYETSVFPYLFDVLSSCCIPSLLCFFGFVFFFSLPLILQIFALSVLNSQILKCSECSLVNVACLVKVVFTTDVYFFLIIFFFFVCFCHVACLTVVLASFKPIILIWPF